MDTRKRITIFVIFLLPDLYFGLPGQLFNITKISCFENPEWFSNVSCTLRLDDKKMSIMDLSANILQPIEKVFVHVKSYIRKENEEYRDGLYDFKIDGCAFLEGKGLSPLGTLVFQYVKQAMKLSFKCPVTGYKEFKNLTLKSDLIPVASNPGHYKFMIRGYVDEPKIDYGYMELHIQTKRSRSGGR